jgi:hypothetical protein
MTPTLEISPRNQVFRRGAGPLKPCPSSFCLSPDIPWLTCCDYGYGRPSWRPRVSAPATYRAGTPRNQHPAVARWHAHLRGLATVTHEISGLARIFHGSPPSLHPEEKRHIHCICHKLCHSNATG